MANDVGVGFAGAITELLLGPIETFVVITLANAFTIAGLLPWYFPIFIIAMVAVTSLIFVFALPTKGILYVSGWTIGCIWLFSTGLIGILEIILYVVIPWTIIILCIYYNL